MSKGSINVYTCKKCGHQTITIDREEGVTPFIIGCDSCKGESYSSFYRCSQGLTPTHEWFKPTIEELKILYEGRMLDGMIDHVEQGGLDLRKIE